MVDVVEQTQHHVFLPWVAKLSMASLTRFMVLERLRLLSSITRALLRANSSTTVRGRISSASPCRMISPSAVRIACC
jgi:hypothetical protein